jgi:hypothetical protein
MPAMYSYSEGVAASGGEETFMIARLDGGTPFNPVQLDVGN